MSDLTRDLVRFIPGPSWVHPDVLAAQAQTVIGHREGLTSEIHRQCEAGLKAVFGTDHRVLISTTSGSGLMEAAVRSLVVNRSLHCVCGSFSSRWRDMAAACGKEPVELSVPMVRVTPPNVLASIWQRTIPTKRCL